jgi:hypothetical protein
MEDGIRCNVISGWRRVPVRERRGYVTSGEYVREG